jgi:hypothetical protein
MFHTGSAAYPVERTLLTTGVLEACLHSRHKLNQRFDLFRGRTEQSPTRQASCAERFEVINSCSCRDLADAHWGLARPVPKFPRPQVSLVSMSWFPPGFLPNVLVPSGRINPGVVCLTQRLA